MACGGSAQWTLNAGGALDSDPAQVIEVSRSPDDAVPWTVTLGPIEKLQSIGGAPTTNAGPLDLNTLFDARAVVQWGSGGAKQRAVIDWPARGVSFGLQGSYLAVGCVATPLVAPSGGSNVQRVRFTATAAPAASSGRKPTRSIIVGSLGASATSNVFDVPPFATEVTVHYTAFDEASGVQFPLVGVNFALRWLGSVPSLGQTRYRGTTSPSAAPAATGDPGFIYDGAYAKDYYPADVPVYAQRCQVENLEVVGLTEWTMVNVVVQFHLTLF